MNLFIPLKVMRKLELSDGSGEMEFNKEEGIVGVLLVYDNEEGLHEAYPDVPIITLQAEEEV